MFETLPANALLESAQLCSAAFSPTIYLTDAESPPEGVDATIDYFQVLDIKSKTAVFSLPPAEPVRTYRCQLSSTKTDELRAATKQALNHAAIDGMKSLAIAFHSEAQERVRVDELTHLLQGVLEYIGEAQVEWQKNISHIFVTTGTATFNAWQKSVGSLASWLDQELMRHRYRAFRVASSADEDRKSIPDDTDIQKAIENMDAFVKVKGKGRNPFMVHAFGRDDEFLIRAAIRAMERRIPEAQLSDLVYMIGYLSGHSYGAGNLTLHILKLFSDYKKFPEDIAADLKKLNILFMERTLELMRDEGIKAEQFSRLPQDFQDPWSFKIFQKCCEVPFYTLFEELFVSPIQWDRVAKERHDLRAPERMILTMERTLEELRR